MFARLVLVLPLANLLLDFFHHQVNRRVKVALGVFGKQIGAAHAQTDGTGKLPLGNAGVVVFERDSGIDGALIQVGELLELART